MSDIKLEYALSEVMQTIWIVVYILTKSWQYAVISTNWSELVLCMYK